MAAIDTLYYFTSITVYRFQRGPAYGSYGCRQEIASIGMEYNIFDPQCHILHLFFELLKYLLKRSVAVDLACDVTSG